MENNIYTLIGIVLLFDLACKNAIFIVEFAVEARERKGMSTFDAAIDTAHLRFRPILMTSFAFILGVSTPWSSQKVPVAPVARRWVPLYLAS